MKTNVSCASFKKSFNSRLLLVTAAIIMMISNIQLHGAVTVTAPSLNISTASFPSAYNALGNIVIDEGANSDFPIAAKNTDYTFTITAPANFEFQAGVGSVSSNVADITTISMVVTATTITVTYRSGENNRVDEDDIITISGIQVRAIITTATQTATKTASTETIVGLTNGTVMANLSSSLPSGCMHTIRLTDTYGDGWSGGTVTVTVNGTPVLTNIALIGMTGPEDLTFPASTGDIINVTRTADGSYPSEMRVEIIGGSANTILATQEPVVAPGTNVVACCAPTVPGVASYTSPANAATGVNTCGTTLVWAAPASTGCNAVAAYDVYFGTAASPPFVANITATTYSTGGLTPSTTYYWKIVPKNAAGSAAGVVTWSFATSATVCTDNDQCSGATPVSCGGTYVGTTATATTTNDPTGTCGTSVGAAGRWYVFAGNGNVVTASLCGSAYDTKINIYSGTCGSYTCVAGNDDFCGSQSQVTFGTSVGVNYYIFVNGYSGATGNYSLSLTCCAPTAPACATLVSPASGATGVSPCGTLLDWNSVASSCGTSSVTYDVYFGTSSNPPFLCNVSTDQYNLNVALSENTVYYWKIVPRDGGMTASGCVARSFTTGSRPNSNYCLVDDALNYPAGGSNCAQITADATSQRGCIWNTGTISFASSFDYTINMYFGDDDAGADGCTFIFQNSPQGIAACGTDGSQLGAGGISNAMVVEFDTYDNGSFDPSEDHTAIYVNGDLESTPLAGPVQADPLDANLEDGLVHVLRVTWNAATQELCVYVDGSQRMCHVYDFVTNVFGGNPNVLWGFTGSTGMYTNQQYFCPINIPVPVEMTGISVNCSKGKPNITWYTASETNNHYFTVERSEDGASFEPVAHINGAGNSNSPIMYQYIDEQPLPSTAYYRLLQTDFDGTTTEIGIKQADCSHDETILEIVSTETLKTGALTINFNTGFAGPHTIQLLDVAGNVVEQQTIMCNPGFNQADFCFPAANGIYLMTIYNPLTAKSIKVHL